MSHKSMSDVLNEARINYQNAQKEQNNKPPAVVAFNPIKAYSNQLPTGSKKPRGKNRK